MHGYCLLGPINSYHSNLMEQFDSLPIQCRHIEHMLEGVWFGKIIFVCKDPTETFFLKLRSAGLNYNLQSFLHLNYNLPIFFTDSYCAGDI